MAPKAKSPTVGVKRGAEISAVSSSAASKDAKEPTKKKAHVSDAALDVKRATESSAAALPTTGAKDPVKTKAEIACEQWMSTVRILQREIQSLEQRLAEAAKRNKQLRAAARIGTNAINDAVILDDDLAGDYRDCGVCLHCLEDLARCETEGCAGTSDDESGDEADSGS